MQLFLRRKSETEPVVPNLGGITLSLLEGDPALPFTIKQLNNLPENIKKRVYRMLAPASLLVRFGIDPLTWLGVDKQPRVLLKAESGSEKVYIAAKASPADEDEFFVLELSDNSLNGIELNLLLLNDQSAPRFNTDSDGQFGMVARNIEEETKAKEAGLAPAQVRGSLAASRQVLDQLETFLAAIGQRAYFLEPLTYASAWVFEKRGFAYVRGHKLMDDINREFQEGGILYNALDDSTFRTRSLHNTVRGRAWAIHDGILDVLDSNWDKLRMVKQVGKHAGVNTFPNSTY